jgi:hypothetical protein
MLIYVNGDSFAAGTGLYDSELIHNYDFWISESKTANANANLNKFKLKYIEERHRSIDKYLDGSHGLYSRKTKQLSWPNLLAIKLGVEVINESESSSSMSSILYRTLLDLTTLQMKGTVPDHVIISLTSKERLATIYNTDRVIDTPSMDHTTPGLYRRPWILSSILGWIPDTNLEIMLKELATIITDSDLYVKYLIEVALLNHVVKSFTGRYPILAAPEFITASNLSETMIRLKENPAFAELFTSSNILNIDSNLVMHPIDILPDGHYGSITHEAFANSVATYIQTLKVKEN